MYADSYEDINLEGGGNKLYRSYRGLHFCVTCEAICSTCMQTGHTMTSISALKTACFRLCLII